MSAARNGLASAPYAIFISSQLDPDYNLSMHFAIITMRVLETMFFLGLAGSAVVVLISFIEDAKELFGED